MYIFSILVSALSISLWSLFLFATTTFMSAWTELVFIRRTSDFILAIFGVLASGYVLCFAIIFIAYCMIIGCLYGSNFLFNTTYTIWSYQQVATFFTRIHPPSHPNIYVWISFPTLITLLLLCFMGTLPAWIICLTQTKKNKNSLNMVRKEALHVSIVSSVSAFISLAFMLLLQCMGK